MEFGIGIPTSGESWKVAQRAEELGFTHAWFYDTQMLVGDPFVAMGAAALKTSRIRLGTGVLVPTNRIAAVTAIRLRDPQRDGTGSDRFRCWHGILGAAGDGAGRHEAR